MRGSGVRRGAEGSISVGDLFPIQTTKYDNRSLALAAAALNSISRSIILEIDLFNYICQCLKVYFVIKVILSFGYYV